MDSLRWTTHMEDSLEVLEREKEFPSDDVLATLVKLQLVSEEAQKLLVQDVMGDNGQTPTFVFKRGILSRLQAIRDGISPNVASNCKSTVRTLMWPGTLLTNHRLGADAHIGDRDANSLCRALHAKYSGWAAY